MKNKVLPVSGKGASLVKDDHYPAYQPSQAHHFVSERLDSFYSIGPTTDAPAPDVPTGVRRASLFRNGRNQAVRIPREFEFPAGEVNMYKDGNRIIIEPITAPCDFAALFASWEPIDEAFPDVDVGLMPLSDVTL